MIGDIVFITTGPFYKGMMPVAGEWPIVRQHISFVGPGAGRRGGGTVLYIVSLIPVFTAGIGEIVNTVTLHHVRCLRIVGRRGVFYSGASVKSRIIRDHISV